MTTVKYRHWLSALHQFSQAQCILLSSQQQAAAAANPHLISALCRASAVIYDAMMLAKVTMISSIDTTMLSTTSLFNPPPPPPPPQASSPPSSFPFQLLMVLASWLNAHCQLLTTCVGLHTLPPPTSNAGGSIEKKVCATCYMMYMY